MKKKWYLVGGVLRLFVVLLSPRQVIAKLMPITLEQVVESSDVIVLGRPMRIRLCDYMNANGLMEVCGEAEVIVNTIVYQSNGLEAGKSILIKWSNEAHDQPVAAFDGNYLLFLKKGDGKYWLPAAYGRSYIKIDAFHKSRFKQEKAQDNERVRQYVNKVGYIIGIPIDGLLNDIVFPDAMTLTVIVANAAKLPVTYREIGVVPLAEVEEFVRRRVKEVKSSSDNAD